MKETSFLPIHGHREERIERGKQLIRKEEKRCIKSSSWENEVTNTGETWRERMKGAKLNTDFKTGEEGTRAREGGKVVGQPKQTQETEEKRKGTCFNRRNTAACRQ